MGKGEEGGTGKMRKCRRKIAAVAQARLPTEYGSFSIVAFCSSLDRKEHIAIVRGDVKGAENVPLRIHSECLTGDVFHSLRCDCRAQLEAALRKIGRLRRGVVLYMRQEGRGIGLANKIRAYALQDRGLDTVQANLKLGFPADMRDYDVAAEMIRLLGIKSVQLITNNPDKMRKLVKYGVRVVRRIPHEFGKNRHNEEYLRVKKSKMRHLLSGV
ncbi:MAG: GTP cyclohydrolase II [Candidatus Micrarchaeota archaeon]|nr:GTP cyclohydrolase II [Candidatus Micrarchaeota archaeon]